MPYDALTRQMLSFVKVCNMITKDDRMLLFCTHLADFMPPKRRVWKEEQKDVMRIFDRLFTSPWPKSSTHALEKGFEYPDFIFCSSFQNLRLGG